MSHFYYISAEAYHTLPANIIGLLLLDAKSDRQPDWQSDRPANRHPLTLIVLADKVGLISPNPNTVLNAGGCVIGWK